MSPGLTAPPPPRSPWQLLYAGAHRLRRAVYRRRAGRLPVPVLSIGNLSWGGAGKTPLTAAVAAHLRDRGLAVCILSRGYGRRGGGVQVVSTGGGPLLPPSRAGDEPVLLAGELPGVAVVVGPRRYEAGLHALTRLDPKPQLFLLDDGFSHLALARDLDLLVLPAADPFAGGRLPPAGRLREPLSAAARAHAVLLTGAVEDGPQGSDLAAALRPHGYTGPGFTSHTRALPARRVTGGELAAGTRVLLVAGIAHPERFFSTVRAQGYAVTAELPFPDHHRYPAASLDRIAATYTDSGAEAVLTTAKDRVKLLGRLDLPLAELPIRAEPEPAFWRWLEERLAGLGLGASKGGEPGSVAEEGGGRSTHTGSGGPGPEIGGSAG